MEFNVVNNPHDALFKRTMNDPENAKDFIVNYLPGELVSSLDLEKLTICKDSFVDSGLEETYSDILYRVGIGGRDGFIYMLFEHKSYPDRMVAVQLLRYMLDIWKLYRKQVGTEKLPVILPVLIYHGEEKWNTGSRLMNIIEDTPSAFKSYIPDYEFLVYDLSEFSEKEIRGRIELQIYLKLMSCLAEGDILKAVREVFPILLGLEEQKTGMEYIETVIRYILSTYEEISLEELEFEAEKISGERSEIVMTIAEKLREEGRKEGKREGRKEGKIEAMQEMVGFALELKFGSGSEQLLPFVNKTDDYDKLEKIKKKIKKANSLTELEKYLQELR